MIICPRCQNQLPDNSVACNRCGLMFNYQPQPQLQQATPIQPTQPKKGSTLKLVLGILGAIFGSILLALIISVAILYAPKNIDYGDETAFEDALNSGTNVTGKIVRFKVREYATPPAGYNLHAGKHLNFVSFTNPGVSTGDTITVKVTKVQSSGDGIWSIWYKKVKNGKETSSTIKSD